MERAEAIRRLVSTRLPAAAILVRAAVGSVFVSEGAQKFLFASTLGAGRFAKIGIPAPHVMGPFVGAVEVVCGALVLVGLLTRLAAIPLVIDMLVAITSTKLPMLLGRGFAGFAAPAPQKVGFWAMAHESRTDLAMLLCAVFLAWEGSGPMALDARIMRALPGEGS